MRRGLKYRGRREPRPTVPPIRRFPDEEGTEIRRDGAAQLAYVLAIRRFPDEEGTEIADRRRAQSAAPSDQKIPR